MIILFFICLFCIGITCSKYYNSFVLSFNGNIARPVFKVDSNESVEITNLNNTGKYEFCIRNFEGDTKSDTQFEYTIEVISNIDEQVDYTLYRDGEKVNLNQKRTDRIFLDNSDKIVHKYCLEMRYKNNDVDMNKDINQNIQIKVDAEQKKL